MKRHAAIIVCSAAAILLLIVFAVLQQLDSAVMKLDNRWLIVAGVPVLLGLLVGRYLKSFKGFGVELEPLLELNISEIQLIAADVVELGRSMEKGTRAVLYERAEADKTGIERLSFVAGKKDHYNADDVIEYLRALPNLKFIEIQTADRKFHSLVPARYFKEHDGGNRERVTDFIQKLEDGRIDEWLGDNKIIDFVTEDEALLEVLKKARKSYLKTLAVVDSSHKLIGVVDDRLLERKIADEVIKIQKSKDNG